MSINDNVQSQSHFLKLNPLTPTGVSKFFFLPLAKYIVNAAIGTPFYQMNASEMLLYAHLYNLADQTRRKQGDSFLDENGRVYILPDTYEMVSFMRSSKRTIVRTLKSLQDQGMIEMELSRYTRQRILYVKEAFPEDENGERIIPDSPHDLPYMQETAPYLRGFYRIPITLCGRRGERKNVYSENLSSETILMYSILLDTALSAANTDAFIESNNQPYIYVRYGYEALAKRLHIARTKNDGQLACSHTSLRKYIQILEGDGTWSGLIQHNQFKNDSPGLGNLKGSNNYSIRDYSVSGLEEGFYLEDKDKYLERMKTESLKSGIEMDTLIRYGSFGYKADTAMEEDKDRPSIIVSGEKNDMDAGSQNDAAEGEGAKSGLRRCQKWTTKVPKMDYEADGQKWTTKVPKMDYEGAKSGLRRCQKWTPKVPKVDNNNKDNKEKEGFYKKSFVYNSSSQDTPATRIDPADIEILPPKEEETTRTLNNFDPHAPGAKEALEAYHKKKRMRCPFEEFWRFNENKNWMANGKKVQDPVALLAGYENRYVKEHPLEEILIENGSISPEEARSIDPIKLRIYQSVINNPIY